MVTVRNARTVLWGNFTSQLKNDQEKFLNIERLILFLQKSLKPTLETFIEEPNDTVTFRRIYYAVRPFLTEMVDKRALYSYEWQGDQDAASLEDLQVNNPTDVGNGKYLINLLIKPIPSLQEISVNIVLTPAGASFDTAASLI